MLNMLEKSELISELKMWTQSKNRWMRRVKAMKKDWK